MTEVASSEMRGWLRSDGRKGIRNSIVVAYLVECAHHVAREIARPFEEADVHVIGFPGCFPNDYAQAMMDRLCTHPNVGGVLLVSLGCENFKHQPLLDAIAPTGRPVTILTIQREGGTRATVELGREWIRGTLEELACLDRATMEVSDLVIGTICGGSDATSGLTGNPAAGRAFDRFVAEGATCIFEETGELIGCEHIMADRAASPEVGQALVDAVNKAICYYDAMGYGSFSHGNAQGGLSTIEEKSLSAYAKSGSSMISGLIRPGEQPSGPGLYLLDVVPDGQPKYGYPNINDNAEIVELIACGAHVVIFITGRGSVVGSAISPVIKVCANPQTFRRMSDDMDVNAGAILTESRTLEEVGDEIHDKIVALGCGQRTVSEDLHHREFVLTYKQFDGLIGPSCQPAGN